MFSYCIVYIHINWSCVPQILQLSFLVLILSIYLSRIPERERGEIKVVQQFNWWMKDWLSISAFEFPIHVLISPLFSLSGIFLPPINLIDTRFHIQTVVEKSYVFLVSFLGLKCCSQHGHEHQKNMNEVGFAESYVHWMDDWHDIFPEMESS